MNTQIIFDYMKEHNLSKTAFAKLCGISLCKLNNLLANNLKTKPSTVISVLKVMGIKAQELLGI